MGVCSSAQVAFLDSSNTDALFFINRIIDTCFVLDICYNMVLSYQATAARKPDAQPLPLWHSHLCCKTCRRNFERGNLLHPHVPDAAESHHSKRCVRSRKGVRDGSCGHSIPFPLPSPLTDPPSNDECGVGRGRTLAILAFGCSRPRRSVGTTSAAGSRSTSSRSFRSGLSVSSWTTTMTTSPRCNLCEPCGCCGCSS